MKPDPEYTRKLLAAFEEAPEPTTDIRELEKQGLDYRSNEFIFHMQLLNDDGIVEREDGDAGFGLVRSIDGLYSWGVVPLRLTASGQEFATAMVNEHGFNAVEKSFLESGKSIGINIMREVAEAGLKAYLRAHGLLP